jgi:hypothetical protein
MPPISVSQKIEMDLNRFWGIGGAANIRENENRIR